MGNKSSPPTPPPSPNIAPPDYGALYSQGLNANINALPAIGAANNASQIQAINQLGPALQQYQDQTAGHNASFNLGLQQQLGPQYTQQALDRLQQTDPAGFALRQNLGNTLNSQLSQGTSLDPAYATQLQQQIRGAQTARGNAIGNAPANAEALYQGEAGLALQQQRTQNAQNYLGLSPLSNQVAQFGGASVPFMPNQAPGGAQVSPNAGQAAVAYGQGIYGTQMQANSANYGTTAGVYNTSANKPNPYMQGLGLALGVGATAAGTAFGGPAGGMAGGLFSSAVNSAIRPQVVNGDGSSYQAAPYVG